MRSWSIQRDFWDDTIRSIYDVPLSDRQILIVIDKGLDRATKVESFSWTMPLQLEKMFRFPSNWHSPPHLYVLSEADLKREWQINSQQVIWSHSWFWFDQPENGATVKVVDPCQVIFLEARSHAVALVERRDLMPFRCNETPRLGQNQIVRLQDLELSLTGKVLLK